MKLRRKLVRLMTAALLVAVVASIGLVAPAMAVVTNSLYVIADLNVSGPIPLQVYAIGAGNPSYQWTGNVTDRDGGAVGIAIDSVSKTLFITYEFSGTLDMVNAQTMAWIGQVTAPAATNLAGIVVDEGQQKVYTVDRGTNHLYVYLWNSVAKTLTLVGSTHVSLAGAVGIYGVALDEINDILYVGSVAGSTYTVRAYNTSDWSSAGTYGVSNKPRGIAFDETRQVIYFCNGGPGGGTKLTKYDIATSTETVAEVGSTTLGAAVDLTTGFVYITTYGGGARGDSLLAYDGPNLTGASAPFWDSGIIGEPTGLVIPRGAVSYNPLNLTKDDGLGGGSVLPGDTITYTISYDNSNNPALTGVVIVDILPPEVTYVSNTGGGVYTAGPPTVTWNIGPVAAGVQGSVTVTVTVNAGTPLGTIITDTCSIDSNETGQAFANEDTPVRGDGPSEPPVEVGGDVSPVNKVALLAPWIALAALILTGATLAVRRRLTQS